MIDRVKSVVVFQLKRGDDACLGYVDDALHACCGHGVERGYIVYASKTVQIESKQK